MKFKIITTTIVEFPDDEETLKSWGFDSTDPRDVCRQQMELYTEYPEGVFEAISMSEGSTTAISMKWWDEHTLDWRSVQ